jgi:hypothetical protein
MAALKGGVSLALPDGDTTIPCAQDIGSMTGSLARGEGACGMIQQLRVFAEILFFAGMNDLSQVQELVSKVRPNDAVQCSQWSCVRHG